MYTCVFINLSARGNIQVFNITLLEPVHHTRVPESNKVVVQGNQKFNTGISTYI